MGTWQKKWQRLDGFEKAATVFGFVIVLPLLPVVVAALAILYGICYACHFIFE